MRAASRSSSGLSSIGSVRLRHTRGFGAGSRAILVMDRGAAKQRQRLVPGEVAQRVPAQRFVLRDRARLGRGNLRRVAAEQRSHRRFEHREPRDVVLTGTDRRHVPVEHCERLPDRRRRSRCRAGRRPRRSTGPGFVRRVGGLGTSRAPRPPARAPARRRSTSRDRRPRSRAQRRCRAGNAHRDGRSARCVAATAPTNAS